MRWLFLLLLLGINGVRSEEWHANNYPNPTAGQFQQCKMRTTANICDPDGVLTESARYRLDHDLKQLESRTRQEGAHSFCDKKGVTGAMAVAKHVKGGSTEAVKQMANDMLQRWTLDSQCQKAIVVVVSTDDMKFWVARDDKVPVYAEEFTEIFMQQKTLFQQKNYQQALTNILQATWERSLSKAGAPRRPSGGSGGSGGGRAGGQQPPYGDGGSGGGAKGMKMPSIPSWIWLAIVFVVIPLLCCCCCIYCCCCRGKGSGATPVPQHPQDGGMGMGGGGGAPRGGGGGGGFLSTLGGAGVGSMIGNFLSRRSAGGGGGGGGMGMGGMGGSGPNSGFGMGGAGAARPAEPQPVYDDNDGRGGGGLYPSAAVKDQGGGGSWA